MKNKTAILVLLMLLIAILTTGNILQVVENKELQTKETAIVLENDQLKNTIIEMDMKNVQGIKELRDCKHNSKNPKTATCEITLTEEYDF